MIYISAGLPVAESVKFTATVSDVAPSSMTMDGEPGAVVSRVRVIFKVVVLGALSLWVRVIDFAPSLVDSVTVLLQLPLEQVAVSLADRPVPDMLIELLAFSQVPLKVGDAPTVLPSAGEVRVSSGADVSLTRVKEVELLFPAVSVEVAVTALFPSPAVKVTD